MKKIVTIIAILLLAGCANVDEQDDKEKAIIATPDTLWEQIKIGKIEGEVILKWHSPDKFLYLPSATNTPFRFTRVNSTGNTEVIQPEAFYTDGGSIPMVGRTFKEFSPWRFAYAYIIHDWLFEQPQCGELSDPTMSPEKAALIMAEIIKTEMVMRTGQDIPIIAPTGGDSKTLLHSIYTAVATVSPIYWQDDKCSCDIFQHQKNCTKD